MTEQSITEKILVEDIALIAKLATPLPAEAIQATKKEETHKGYDTTGLGYQYCVNRFNEILGIWGWGFSWNILKEITGTYKSGTPFFDITVAVSIWVGKTTVNESQNKRTCIGGHVSTTYADALKGAITNGFKKTAAFWGVGRQAYEGSLDDDTFVPAEHGTAPKKEKPELLKSELPKQEVLSKPEPSGPELPPRPDGGEGLLIDIKNLFPGSPEQPPNRVSPGSDAPQEHGNPRQFIIKDPNSSASDLQRRKIFAIFKTLGFDTDTKQRGAAEMMLGVATLKSFKDLTKGEASRLIEKLVEEEAKMKAKRNEVNKK